MKFVANLSVLAVCLVLGSGCATRALWEEGRFAEFREPATPLNLELFERGSDGNLLVVYDEETDRGAQRMTRAFWVDPSVQPPDRPGTPRFVAVNSVASFRAVPVGDAPRADDFSAVTNGLGNFTLYKDGQEVWKYRLPAYEDSSGRIKQIALTPLTLVADITIVGGVMAFYSLRGGWGTL